MKLWHTKRRRPARGVSLMEVLFSIGIIMIGLLGVIALIPLGGVQANKGLTSDRGAQLARSSFYDFQTRGMHRPENWLLWAPPPDGRFLPVLSLPASFRAGQSFLIDSRFVADPSNQVPAGSWFPYSDPADANILRIPRITLRSDGRVLPAAQPQNWMGGLQADRLFVSRDQLTFELPKDSTLLPVQNYGQTPTQRQYDGNLSWMTMITPKLDRLGNLSDQFRVFIIVMNRRLLQMNSSTATTPANERVALVFPFLGVGSRGGNVQLVGRPASTNPQQDLRVREQEWVMLSGNKLTAGGVVRVHSWYRVIGVDSEPAQQMIPAVDPTNPVWTLNVTLHGPDWDAAETFITPASPSVRAQATMVSGVVEVYEKTIRLESSSLWYY